MKTRELKFKTSEQLTKEFKNAIQKNIDKINALLSDLDDDFSKESEKLFNELDKLTDLNDSF